LLCGGVLVVFVVFTRRASVFVPLKAILIPVCLNKLVTFLIIGDDGHMAARNMLSNY